MTSVQERKAAERAARRQRIQQAARTVFSERGFAGTSIEQVARASQLSVGAIYLYFKSKEDLYVSLLEDSLLLFDAELTQLAHHTAAADRLQATWTYLVTWTERDPEGARILRLLAQPGLGTALSSEVIGAVGAGLTRVREHLASAVTAGIEAGAFRPADTSNLASHAWSLLMGTLSSQQTHDNLGLEVADFGTRAASALGLLLASLAPQAPSPTATIGARAIA